MLQRDRYQLTRVLTTMTPNIWDLIALTIVIACIAAVAWSSSKVNVSYYLGDNIDISLMPSKLPGYALQTVLRMFIAMFFSLLATFTLAPLAAGNRHAERFLIPAIDILQSIPILGMLSISVLGFISLFPGSRLGPECAAIFVIFTSQVWNMILSLYQSLKTVSPELLEAAKVYQLNAWQTYWKIKIPHATPGLLWNAMMSMSAGWFFVVLSEAISVANHKIMLPGIGSYISKAISMGNMPAMCYAIIAMFLVILLYDQLLFRPLLAWSEKFKSEIDEENPGHTSWFYELLAQTHLLKKLKVLYYYITDSIFPRINLGSRNQPQYKINWQNKLNKIFWNLAIISSIAGSGIILYKFIYTNIALSEIQHVIWLGLITATKVIILIILASIIWVPIGVWIGFNAKLAYIVQPMIQFLAAFPANFFYPLVVILILKYKLEPSIWTTPLMILGTQWYILFNVIGGTTAIPKEIRLCAKNFHLTGWLWWRRLIIPAIFPFYVTGAMAAAGGCWNASIVAEHVSWEHNTIISPGLGSYITQHTEGGDFARVALGIAIMCGFVILFNRVIWQRLYNYAEERFKL